MFPLATVGAKRRSEVKINRSQRKTTIEFSRRQRLTNRSPFNCRV
jgi:hypothetical protein